MKRKIIDEKHIPTNGCSPSNIMAPLEAAFVLSHFFLAIDKYSVRNGIVAVCLDGVLNCLKALESFKRCGHVARTGMKDKACVQSYTCMII